jgi:hypothetical protein
VHAEVKRESGMQRLKAQQYQAIGREFLENVFTAKPGEVFAAAGPSGVYIGRLDAARPGEVQQTAQLTAAIRPRVSQSYAEDLLSATQDAARKSMKVSLNVALARQTIGVDANILGKGATATNSAKAP